MKNMSASVCDGISVIRRSLEMSEAAFGGGGGDSGGTGDSMVPNPPSTPPGPPLPPPPPPSKSMKVILNTFQSDLPSYEDATSGSISSSTIKKENSEGKIISTTVNAMAADVSLSCESTTIITMKANKSGSSVAADGTEVEIRNCSLTQTNNTNGQDDQDSRITWDSDIDFLLSIIGFAVDLANVWRFPYLCYRNGGGAFLIPYVLMLVLGALPLFYMEVILGQFNRQGPISLWKICPIFKGVGYCAVFIAFYVSFYYNVIIAWSLFYVFNSLTSRLPWDNCDNPWNTELCRKTCYNDTVLPCNASRSPSKEYFNFEVLRLDQSSGIDDIGAPIWKLVVCTFIVYCILYLSLFKGVKSSGKVVWITATMPYALLFILLVRGLMLPGASDGIHFYLVPDLERLKESEVWIDAAVQIFYSVGAGFGVHLAYASYNKFDNNCYRDCLFTSVVNCATSFFSGFVIFTYLGYMAHYQDRDIKEVAEQGPGLVFEVYPEAIATLPGSQIWSILFFCTLIMLGMDSAMGGLECVITGLMDEFDAQFKKVKVKREAFTGFIVFFSFFVAMCCVTPGGMYVFNLLETYVAGLSLLSTVFFEAIAVSWLYGLDQFKKDVEKMLGHTPGLYWRICWKIVSPVFLAIIMVLQMMNIGPFIMTMYDKSEYVYPAWARAIGWILGLSSVLCVPIFAIKAICSQKGTFKQRLILSITPEDDQKDLSEGRTGAREHLSHWISL